MLHGRNARLLYTLQKPYLVARGIAASATGKSARMREKELRLALVCYGGVSLAIYMHGVTKVVWTLLRASTARGRLTSACAVPGAGFWVRLARSSPKAVRVAVMLRSR